MNSSPATPRTLLHPRDEIMCMMERIYRYRMAKEAPFADATKRMEPGAAQRHPVYAAMVHSRDDAVGRLLDTPDELQLADRTLIVFTSDNGGRHNVAKEATNNSAFADIPVTSNAPLRSGKASNYEGGTRVPLVVAWPGKIAPASKSDALFQSTDFFPSLLDACGLKPQAGQRFDGVSQMPALLGTGSPRELMFSHFPHGGRADVEGFLPGTWVRRGDWKLIRLYAANDEGSDRLELYDLAADLGEIRNLAAEKPQRRECRLRRWTRSRRRAKSANSHQRSFDMKLRRTTAALFAALFTLAVSALAAEPPVISKQRPDGTVNRAAWMAEGGFGMMVHFLPLPPAGSREERQAWVDRTVNAFDLAGFMRQFDETGADWLIFTLTQTNGVLTSANPVVTAQSELLMSRRDLVMEIAQQLAQRGKRLVLYIPSDNEPTLRAQSGIAPADYAAWYRTLIRAYSEKFGMWHHGWWFDTCGPLPAERWQEWLADCRAGNPDSAVAFSGAEFCTGGDVMPHCPIEDYHAGEIHVLDGGRIRRDFLVPGGTFTLTPDGAMQRAGHTAHYYMPDGQYIGNVQWHCLLPINMTFNPAIPERMCRYSDDELFGFVKHVKSVGGAITINVPINTATGIIPADSHAQLVRLRRALGK